MTKKRDSSTIPNADGVSVACEPAGKRAKAAVPAKPPMRILQWNVNGLRALALVRMLVMRRWRTELIMAV